MSIDAELRRLSQLRHDGYWELLATSAGSDKALDGTLEGLSYTELTKGPRGMAGAPSFVAERVEALAAFDPERLAVVAADWPRPELIDDDPWLAAAWRTALRHLASLARIEREEALTGLLEEEARIVWGANSATPVSFRELARRASEGFVDSDTIRASAHAPLLEPSLGEEDLRLAPTDVLRLLRGRASVLDTSARYVLADRTLASTSDDPFHSALLVELSHELGLEIEGSVKWKVSKLLAEARDPRQLVPLIYVLLTSWRVP